MPSKNLSDYKHDPPTYHMLKIALDTVKHPMKALLGGPSVEQARETLKSHGITEAEAPVPDKETLGWKKIKQLLGLEKVSKEKPVGEAFSKSTYYALIDPSRKIIDKGSKHDMWKKVKELNKQHGNGSYRLGITTNKIGDKFDEKPFWAKEKPVGEAGTGIPAWGRSDLHVVFDASSKKIIDKGSKHNMWKKVKELNKQHGSGSYRLGLTTKKIGDTFTENAKKKPFLAKKVKESPGPLVATPGTTEPSTSNAPAPKKQQTVNGVKVSVANTAIKLSGEKDRVDMEPMLDEVAMIKPPKQESEPDRQARLMGLSSYGKGRYGRANAVTHEVKNGQLVRLPQSYTSYTVNKDGKIEPRKPTELKDRTKVSERHLA